MPAADGLSKNRQPRLTFPDPLMSANVYANRHLDTVLQSGLVPFWQQVVEKVRASGGYLWIIRYSRRGEHLKLRLHAPSDMEAELREGLERSLLPCLSNLPVEQGERPLRDEVPAIDPEDEEPEHQPDRTLLWTNYRRSFVSLGSEPWLQDETYVAHETAFLGAGFELVVAAVEKNSQLSHRVRQSSLIKAVISGLAALGLGSCAGTYLTYHRDWLLRFFVGEPEREAELVARFEDKIHATPNTIVQLRNIVRSQWSEDSREPIGTDSRVLTQWVDVATQLANYTRQFSGIPEYLSDPFAEDPVFPPAFKALHGTANQLGMPPLQEAFVHHLLLHASEAEFSSCERSEAVTQ